ncbi:MAG: glycosyltransferase family 39 protein [Candidatus Nealsonbacteria bacterium]|nr:glycosyltransferase family 39 protein [Candidatus Nealsonbacteria bacterium]
MDHPPPRTFCRLPLVLWLILAVALGLRLWGACRGNLTFDERAHWALAETIDLRPGSLHLVSRSVDHPPLSIYTLKLSSLLFGTSDLGLRMLHLLAGTLTVVPVYLLGKRIFSPTAGLWAAGLLAVDQFHASWSRVFMPEVLMLAAASLVLLQYVRTLKTGRTRDFVLLGVLLGVAYLAKEPSLWLLAALWLVPLIARTHRRLLRRPAWYLAHGVFLAVIAPDLIWNLSLGTESYLFRNAAMLDRSWAISLKSFSLYLGELLRFVAGANVLDKGYIEGNVYVCHWPAGLLYLAAIAAVSVRWFARRRQTDHTASFAAGGTAGRALLLVVFFVVFVCGLIMPGGERFDPFWWASISLIPAVVCAGWVLTVASWRSIAIRVVAVVLLIGLGARSVTMLWYPGKKEPRTTVEKIVTDFIARADKAIERGDLDEAQNRFVYVLNIGGPNADAYHGLARVANLQGRRDRAIWWSRKGRTWGK